MHTRHNFTKFSKKKTIHEYLHKPHATAVFLTPPNVNKTMNERVDLKKNTSRKHIIDTKKKNQSFQNCVTSRTKPIYKDFGDVERAYDEFKHGGFFLFFPFICCVRNYICFYCTGMHSGSHEFAIRLIRGAFIFTVQTNWCIRFY